MSVLIRAWELGDAEDLARALNNPKVQFNLRDGIPLPYTKSDAMNYIRSMLNAEPNAVYAFAIVADEKMVGSVGAFRGSNIHFRTAEIGYYIAEEYWGRGIATESVRQLCNYLFNNTDIVRVYAEPFERNAASCRVLEKAGFQFEGLLRANAVKDEKLLNMRLYSRLSNKIEW